MRSRTAETARKPPLDPAGTMRWFLTDLAQVSGFAVLRTAQAASPYVMRRPILTTPDPWFYAGLVALEGAKIADLFEPDEAGALLHELTAQVGPMVAWKGPRLATLVFALMGRVGYAAIIMRAKVHDSEIGRMIRVLMGGSKDWRGLIPNAKAHRQICKALATGTPSWWSDFTRVRAARGAAGDLRRALPVADIAVPTQATRAPPPEGDGAPR